MLFEDFSGSVVVSQPNVLIDALSVSTLACLFFFVYVLEKKKMRDRARRVRAFTALVAKVPPGDDCAHTCWCGDDTLVFRPADLVPSERALVEGARALRRAVDVERVVVVVDCVELTPAHCTRLWRDATWSQIRRGLRLFSTLPCRVDALVVHPPAAPFPLWDRVVRGVAALLPRKLRARVIIEDAGG